MSDASGRYRIAIDVGGTFTDLVTITPDASSHFVKVPTTRDDQSLGVMQALARMADILGTPLGEILGNTERIVHGMTVATNALLEHKGARVGLLTTEGHRDILEMREGLKPERYDVRMPRVPTLVPRHLRLPVRERMRADGTVETALDEASVRRAAAKLRRAKVDAVAVCFLHAYANDTHERLAGDILGDVFPRAYVSLSSQVLPRIKEYDRLATTTVNAYVGPLIGSYLERLEGRLSDAGYPGRLLVILSHGGVAPADEAVRIAAATALSGPAGGLAGARRVAEMMQAPDLVSFDMGGTSTDIALVVNGETPLASDREVSNQRIALPSLDIITLGAGGGSLARGGDGSLLEVGPHSAGAIPGPACYGHGGTGATVTDANVVLGYLDPDTFGGGHSLDAAAALEVMHTLAQGLGVTAQRAAQGVYQVVNTQMAEGIRLATVRRGVDPRRFALLGFGGAAGVHVSALARLLGIRRVIVPRVASVLSAWGMLATELRIEAIRSHLGDTGALNLAELRTVYEDLEREGRNRLARWFDGAATVQRCADMRYGEQVYEIDVPLAAVDLNRDDALQAIDEAFQARHRELYTYALPDQPAVLVNARTSIIGALPTPPDEPRVSSDNVARPTGSRRVLLDRECDVPVYRFDELAAEQVLSGPALVDSDSTTVLLRQGDEARVTDTRWLDIRIG
jgi:N-methylhydantoinase A